MTITMTVLACFLTLSLGFILGAAYSSAFHKIKVDEVKLNINRVITILQLKLVTENDHRGFHTRTQVSAWLKKMGPEVQEELMPGANHGSKTV